MGYSPSRRNREKVHTCACLTILRYSDPRAVADGRKQEGSIRLLGKLPPRIFGTFDSRNAMTER